MKTKILADFQIYISVPLISVFQEFSSSINKTSIFGRGDWALGYHSMKFRHLATPIYHVYK